LLKPVVTDTACKILFVWKKASMQFTPGGPKPFAQGLFLHLFALPGLNAHRFCFDQGPFCFPAALDKWFFFGTTGLQPQQK
jgi:hypothetical protein